MDIPEWYDENRTIKEMVINSGKSRSTIWRFLKANNLKFKQLIRSRKEFPNWYNENCTISEMAAISGKHKTTVASFLRNHNLKCKSDRIVGIIPSWYNENMTSAEMAKLANMKPQSVTAYLKVYNLPYKKMTGSSNRTFKRKYSFEEFMKFYNKNLTVREISMRSNIPEKNVRNYLNIYKLEYYRLNRRLEIGDWYNPSLTLKEMSSISGIAENDLRSLLYRRRLPYNRSNYESKTAVL